MFLSWSNVARLSVLPAIATASLLGPLANVSYAGTTEQPRVEVDVEYVQPTVEHEVVAEPVYKESEETQVYEVYEEVYEVEAPQPHSSSGEVVEAEVIIEGEPSLPGLFSCVEQPVPTTVFYSPEGALPVIHWVSEYFSHSGWDPLTRCRAVAGRFQSFYKAGTLNYLTTGIVNRLPVVCVAEQVGGSCSGVLLTLKPGQNGDEVVQQLFDLSYGRQVGALYESGSRIYINVEDYLEGLAERHS